MLVRVHVVPGGREERLELGPVADAQSLLRALGLPLAASIVMRRGVPVPLDEPLADGDDLEVVYVASGG